MGERGRVSIRGGKRVEGEAPGEERKGKRRGREGEGCGRESEGKRAKRQ